MNKTIETIKEFELMTAGRFYTEEQMKRIFNLIARANTLSKGEEAELKALIFSEDIMECKTETDCANSILMASLIESSESKKEIFQSRKQTLESLAEKRLFDSRESWLMFIHSSRRSFYNLFEKAIYLYAMQRVAEAAEIFAEIADNYHYLSVKLSIALFGELNIVNKEGIYLIIFSRILEELLYDNVPVEYVDRLHEIWNAMTEEQIEKAYSLKLSYFDEDSELGDHIGFN